MSIDGPELTERSVVSRHNAHDEDAKGNAREVGMRARLVLAIETRPAGTVGGSARRVGSCEAWPAFASRLGPATTFVTESRAVVEMHIQPNPSCA